MYKFATIESSDDRSLEILAGSVSHVAQLEKKNVALEATALRWEKQVKALTEGAAK